MHAGDHRLGQVGEGQHQPAAVGEGGFIGLAPRIAAQLLEVVAGAKGGAGGGNHYDLHRRVGLERGQRVDQLAHQGHGKRIARRRPVERQGGDAVRDPLQQDRLVLDELRDARCFAHHQPPRLSCHPGFRQAFAGMTLMETGRHLRRSMVLQGTLPCSVTVVQG